MVTKEQKMENAILKFNLLIFYKSNNQLGNMQYTELAKLRSIKKKMCKLSAPKEFRLKYLSKGLQSNFE